MVNHFRQILIWPLQLNPLPESSRCHDHWELLTGADCPWRAIEDEFTDDPHAFGARHYFEFVNFLPFVQRFLYGSADPQQTCVVGGKSSLRAFRHRHIARARLTPTSGSPVRTASRTSSGRAASTSEVS